MAKKDKEQKVKDRKNEMAKRKPGPPTQKYLDIAEVREDVVVMRDGTVRGVMLVSSINFALKSREEQEAIIQGYMQFLNGLEHNLQIVVQSRKMNIDAYLAALQQQYKEQQNELLKTQIKDYIAFVKELVELGDIMSKRFYIVVPYNPLSDKRKNFFRRASDVLSPSRFTKLSKKRFDERKTSLDKRVTLIQTSLQSMGLQTVRLDTQSLIELYYGAYNPDVAQVQKLSDLDKFRVDDYGLPSV